MTGTLFRELRVGRPDTSVTLSLCQARARGSEATNVSEDLACLRSKI